MNEQDVIALVLVYAIIGVSLIASELVKRRFLNADSRKIVHIGVGNFVFVWWMFSEGWIMLAFFAIPFSILLFIAMFEGNVVSRSRLGDISNKMGHRTGLFLYALSIGVMIVVFRDHWIAASIGMVAMTYGDGFGSVIGKRFGRHRGLGGKSIEGSLGVFAATAIVGFVLISLYGYLASIGAYSGDTYGSALPAWCACAIAGFVAMLVEAFCPGKVDNLAISLCVATSMVLIGV